jgi:hypothetical protein
MRRLPRRRTKPKGHHGLKPFGEPLEDRTLLAVTINNIPSYEIQGPANIANSGPLFGSLYGQQGQSNVGNSGVGGSETAGAIDAIAVDPNNPAVGFVGSVDGGVWRTDNLNNVDNGGFMHTGHDHWVPLTDQLPSLSIESLAFMPKSSNVLFAGIGDNSSGGPPNNIEGGALTGILRTQDGGNTWKDLGMRPPAVRPSVNPTGAGTMGGLLLPGTYDVEVTYTENGG